MKTMRTYTMDGSKNRRSMEDVSLNKMKLKKGLNNKNSHNNYNYSNNYQGNEYNNNNNDDGFNEYVIASKNRTVTLQFASPIRRKRTNGLKQQKRKEEVAPYGAVRGIKNLSNNKPFSTTLQKLPKKKGGLEGTFIEFNENGSTRNLPGALGEGSFDKGVSIDVVQHQQYQTEYYEDDNDHNYYNDSDDDDEELNEEEESRDGISWVEFMDKNYYRSFLKSIQCRVAVTKMIDDNQMEFDSVPYNRRMSVNGKISNKSSKNMNQFQCLDEDDFQCMDIPLDDDDEEREMIMRRAGKEHGKQTRQGAPRETGGQSLNSSLDDDIRASGSAGSALENSRQRAQRNENNTGWTLDALLGEFINLNACGISMPNNKCSDVQWGDGDSDMESSDGSSVISLDPPTALYAAIGTKNWNVALHRLMEAPEEAEMWVSTGTSENGTIIEFLPLHLALMSEAPLFLVTLLVQAFPEATEEEAMGKLPIHVGIENAVDYRIIFLLLNTFPECLQVEDDQGNTPIKLASIMEKSKERGKIIQVLTRKMENEVVTTPTALYDAIDCQNWNYAIRRLVEMPQESTTWISFKAERFLPLHAACFMGAPYLLVSDLIQAYPDAMRKKTLKGKLPLHLACAALVDERIIKLLLEQYPAGLNIKDSEGKTAYDVTEGLAPCPERSNIIELLEEKMENTDEKFAYAPTMLYSYVKERNWDFAVRRVLEAPDEAAVWVAANKKSSHVKYLPLHIACSMRAPLMLVAVLVRSYPKSVEKRTKSGKLPLHICCENRASHRVISFLLQSWPESFHVKDNKGQTCVQSALTSKESKQRTKNVETLIEFEKQGGNPSAMPQIDIDEGIQIANSRPDGSRHQSGVVEKNMKQSDSNKVFIQRKKKGLLGRKKKSKTLWASDALMFKS